MSLLKVGTGTLTLTGQSTYSGGTSIADGAITAGVANALPAGTALTVGPQDIPAGNGTFNTGGFAQTISSLTIYPPNAAGGPVLNVGTGTLTLDGNISLLDVTSDSGNLNPAIIAAGAGGTLDLGGAVRNITVAGQDNGATPGDLTINAIVTDGGINFTGNPSTNGNLPTGMGDPILPGFASGASPTISLGALSSTSTTVNLGNANFSGGAIAAASTTFSVGALGTSSTFAGVIVNTVNGSNPITSSVVTLIKAGTGTLTLTGSNSYTGLTEINGGTLQVAGGGSINNGGVLVQGGTLQVAGGGSVNEAGTSLVLGVPVVGNGSLSITGGSVTDSDGTLGIGGGASGTATLTSGTWNNITSLEVSDIGGGIGTLNLTGSGVVTVASGAGTLTLGVGGTLNLGAGGMAGTLNAASVNGDSGVACTSTVNFNQNGTYTFSPQLTGQLSVNQSGTGTTILAGNSSYTGPTTVTAGSLIVNGSLSGASALSVNGGTLSGTGSVGAVTVNSGGTLAANTPNFTTGPLSLTAASTFALSINTGMATAGKVTASSLTLDSGDTVVLTISDTGIATALARGTKFAFLDYDPGSGPAALFSYTGIINGVDTTAALNQGAQITLGDNIYSFSYDGTDGMDSALTLTVIPEPATWAMLLIGFGFLAPLQRSRRRRRFQQRS